MIKEAIDRILELAEPHREQIEDLEYTSKPLTLVAPPLPAILQVTTLQALADWQKKNPVDVENFVHIVSPVLVQLVETHSDDYGRRHVYVSAQFPKEIEGFRYSTWHSAENFLISLEANFQRFAIDKGPGEALDNDLDYVRKIASQITVTEGQAYADDGVTQNITLQKSIAMKENTTLKPRVVLAPYRTFPEIDQTPSDFVFRVRSDDGEPQLALFPADGGRWRLDTVKRLADWFDGKVDVPVLY